MIVIHVYERRSLVVVGLRFSNAARFESGPTSVISQTLRTASEMSIWTLVQRDELLLLLVAEGVYGVESRCASGGVEAGNDSDHGRDADHRHDEPERQGDDVRAVDAAVGELPVE